MNRFTRLGLALAALALPVATFGVVQSSPSAGHAIHADRWCC
jgi:hypothetical protein